MNIVEIIKKAPKDHVYWSLIFGECEVDIIKDNIFPIYAHSADKVHRLYLTEKGTNVPTMDECLLFPSRDNRDWAAFERELDTKEENNAADFYKGKKLFTDEDFNFYDSIKFPNTFDRPMMAAVICAGLLAGGCKDKGAALINKAVNYADMILEYTKEESNE